MSETKLVTGIVGAGQAGTSLLQLLLQSETMKVDFVVDNNAEAAGIVLAKKHGVPTFQNMDDALRGKSCDIVFEMTGVPLVMEKLQAAISGSATKILPSHCWALIRELEEGAKRTRNRVTEEITAIEIRLNGSLDGSRKLVTRINQIMSNMRVLSMNAAIEAARAGSHGAGFAVVADHIAKSVDSVRKITEEIDNVNTEILEVSQQINTALDRLA